MIQSLIVSTFLFTSVGWAQNWTIEDHLESNKIALETFEKNRGAEAYKNIKGWRLVKGDVSSEVFITYQVTKADKTVENKTVRLFCHIHNNTVMDCH